MANTDTLSDELLAMLVATKTKLTNIANAIRSKSKKTDTLSLDDMVTEINSLGSMDWIKGGVTFNKDNIKVSDSTASVRRHGNAVIVDLYIVLAKAITEGAEILTFNEGWKSNITDRIPVYREFPTADGTSLTIIYFDMFTGDGSIYAYNEADERDKIRASFGFEAQPLT